MSRLQKLGLVLACLAIVGASLVAVLLQEREGEDDRIRTGDSTTKAPAEDAVTPTPVGERAEVAPTGNRAPPDPVDSGTTIRVVRASGGVVPGAVIYGVTADTMHRLGLTDSSGTKTADLLGVEVLTVASPGNAVEDVVLRGPPPDEITVIVDTETTLAGDVLHAGGNPVGAGLRVVALPSDRAVDRERVRLALAGEELLVSTTDGLGRFVLGGLEAGRAYYLYAGGQGYFSEVPTRRTIAGETDQVRLRVRRLYAARVRVVERGGGPLRLYPRLRWHGGFQINAKGADVSWISMAVPWVPELAGGQLRPNDPRDHFDSLVLLEYDGGGDEFHFGYKGSLPGYAPFAVRVMAKPISEPIPDRAVELDPTATGFGSVRVTLEPAHLAAEHILAYGGNDHGELVLRAEGTDLRGQSRVSLEDPSGAELIEGIPYGSYEIHYKAKKAPFRHPERRGQASLVHVGPEEVSFSVPVHHVGSIRLILTDSEGSIYTERCRVTAFAEAGFDPEAMTALDPFSKKFFRGPYVLPFLPEGDYRVQVEEPFETDLYQIPIVSVQRGEVSELQLRIP